MKVWWNRRQYLLAIYRYLYSWSGKMWLKCQSNLDVGDAGQEATVLDRLQNFLGLQCVLSFPNIGSYKYHCFRSLNLPSQGLQHIFCSVDIMVREAGGKLFHWLILHPFTQPLLSVKLFVKWRMPRCTRDNSSYHRAWIFLEGFDIMYKTMTDQKSMYQISINK